MKFPVPADRSANEQTTTIGPDRMRKLYNQANSPEAKTVSQKVRDWIETEARSLGWVGIHFMHDCQTSISAGCLLWAPVKHGILKVTDEMLVLIPKG